MRRSLTSQSPQKVSTVGTVAGRTNTQVSAGAHRLSVLGWTPPCRARAPLGFLVWRRERLEAWGKGQWQSFLIEFLDWLLLSRVEGYSSAATPGNPPFQSRTEKREFRGVPRVDRARLFGSQSSTIHAFGHHDRTHERYDIFFLPGSIWCITDCLGRV